jgi:hypothetical protein
MCMPLYECEGFEGLLHHRLTFCRRDSTSASDTFVKRTMAQRDWMGSITWGGDNKEGGREGGRQGGRSTLRRDRIDVFMQDARLANRHKQCLWWVG